MYRRHELTLHRDVLHSNYYTFQTPSPQLRLLSSLLLFDQIAQTNEAMNRPAMMRPAKASTMMTVCFRFIRLGGGFLLDRALP